MRSAPVSSVLRPEPEPGAVPAQPAEFRFRAAPTEHESRLLVALVAGERLTPLLADRVRRVQSETSDRLPAVLLKLGLLSESDLANTLATHCGLTRIQPGDLPDEPLPIAGINPAFLRSRQIVPLAWSDQSLTVACWDPLDEQCAQALRFALQTHVEWRVGTRRELITALDRLYMGEAAEPGTAVGEDTALEDDEVDRLKDLARNAPVIRLVQRLLDDAIAARASDIHLEPTELLLQVRLRTDGLLYLLESHPKALAAPVVSRIKVMAGLNIAERRLPQDGRLRMTIHGKDVDFRVATSPTLHGESVVLRILDRQDVSLDLDTLGFDPTLTATLREAVSRPSGIVLVTGPTGSGKTTTLYAALATINTPDRKILTVEDPVEYILAGVNQVPIRPRIGLSFARALRAFLRQDPDVLMVGEIRDRETAEIAIQAALTGHLLLSTLHTNSAAAAVTRLLDMGIDDYLLASTLHLVLGQRLVRRLCADCCRPYDVTPAMRQRFNVTLDSDLQWRRPGGCDACNGTGYVGRIAIVEALPMIDVVRTRILTRADAHTIEKTAVQTGMRTMLQHGIQRVCAGETTIEEVLRVIGRS